MQKWHIETKGGRMFVLILNRPDNIDYFSGLANAIYYTEGHGFYAMETTDVFGMAKRIIEKAISSENKVSFLDFLWKWEMDPVNNGEERRVIENFMVVNKKGKTLFSWKDVRFLLL